MIKLLIQRSGDMLPPPGWLSPAERTVLASLRLERRRGDWLLGRWTAKKLLSTCLGLDTGDLSAVEIIAAADGAPQAFVSGAPSPLGISISHRGGRAMSAAAPAGKVFGCDLELIEPLSAELIEDFFRPEEQAVVAAGAAADRPLLASLIWSAKESALKALRQGLREDTRSVCVRLGGQAAQGWEAMTVERMAPHGNGPSAFHGWWRRHGELVLTVASAPAWPPPRGA